MLELSRRIGKPIMLRLGSNTRVAGLRLAATTSATRRTGMTQLAGVQINGGSALIENNEIFGWPAEGIEAIDTPGRLSNT